nr:unnamed protein product [Digitaria exilis]
MERRRGVFKRFRGPAASEDRNRDEARSHSCVAGGAGALLWSWDASARSLRLAMAIVSSMRGVCALLLLFLFFRSAELLRLSSYLTAAASKPPPRLAAPPPAVAASCGAPLAAPWLRRRPSPRRSAAFRRSAATLALVDRLPSPRSVAAFSLGAPPGAPPRVAFPHASPPTFTIGVTTHPDLAATVSIVVTAPLALASPLTPPIDLALSAPKPVMFSWSLPGSWPPAVD